jgi:hypothetical protein
MIPVDVVIIPRGVVLVRQDSWSTDFATPDVPHLREFRDLKSWNAYATGLPSPTRFDAIKDWGKRDLFEIARSVTQAFGFSTIVRLIPLEEEHAATVMAREMMKLPKEKL